MKGSVCMLCGHEYPTGLNIMGCFLCFHCEQNLLRPGAARRISVKRRRKLAQWADKAIVLSQQ